MNKILILVLLSVVVVSSAGIASAIPWIDNIGKINQPIPFKVTLKITDWEQVAGGKDSDGSYFLVYGIDQNKNAKRIIEIQNNMFSTAGNLLNAKDINRDYNWFAVKENKYNIITFECNGFDNLDAIEEYPQCFKILSIKTQ